MIPYTIVSGLVPLAPGMVDRIAFFTAPSLRNLQNGPSLARIGIQKDRYGRSVMEKPVDWPAVDLP